jgi:hypothetical protein
LSALKSVSALLANAAGGSNAGLTGGLRFFGRFETRSRLFLENRALQARSEFRRFCAVVCVTSTDKGSDQHKELRFLFKLNEATLI